MITIHSSPQKWSPAFNPLHWLISSNNINNEGFEYLVQIKGRGGQHLRWAKLPKAPPNGYGNIDLSEYLSPYIAHVAGLTIGGKDFLDNRLFECPYQLVFGEMYASWPFTDNFHSSGRVGFTANTPHNYTVGQQINIDQDVPYTNIEYQGVHTVFAVPDQYSIVIDEPFASSTPPEGGIIRAEDGSPIVFTGLTSSTISYAAGYSLPVEEFGRYSGHGMMDEYVHYPGSMMNKKWMTDMPYNFRLRLSAQCFIPLRNSAASNFIKRMRIFTYEQDGTPVGEYTRVNAHGVPSEPTTVEDYAAWPQWVYAAIGPANIDQSGLNVVFGPTSPFGGKVAYYDVKIELNDTLSAMDTFFRIQLDRRCPHNETVDLLFMDKKGSWSTFSFIARNERTQNTSVATYGQTDYGRIYTSSARGSMMYEPTDLGSAVFSVDDLRGFKLRCEWLTDQEAEYFEELRSSPRVYWLKQTDLAIPVLVDVGDWDREENSAGSIIRYEISITKAYKEVVPIPATYLLRQGPLVAR
jgi:hypothetical protein